jgi:hypothetical protein
VVSNRRRYLEQRVEGFRVVSAVALAVGRGVYMAMGGWLTGRSGKAHRITDPKDYYQIESPRLSYFHLHRHGPIFGINLNSYAFPLGFRMSEKISG